MPFPTSPAAGDKYANPANNREYIYFECSPGVGYWDHAFQSGDVPKFEEYDNAKQYVAGDHVYLYSSLFEALQPTQGVDPIWAETTANWKYVGNYLVYNPVGNDHTDGSVPTYIGGRYILQKHQSFSRTSGVVLKNYQNVATLSTPPKTYVKLTTSVRMNGGAASYVPSIIVNSAGWADLGATIYAPEDQTYSAFNQEAGVQSVGFLLNTGEEQFVVKDFTDADWGNDGDGLRTVPQSYRNLMAAGTIIDGRRGSGTLTFEAHVNKGDGRWDCHYTYVGAMGNHKANYGRIEMGWSWPQELFDNMSAIGFKMMKRPDKTHTTEIDFRWQCEWE